MFTNRLINQLGLIKFQTKTTQAETETVNSEPITQDVEQTSIQVASEPVAKPEIKLDKNEFRLLVKMLQAIDHDCVYEDMDYDGSVVRYSHPKTTLVFSDINTKDDATNMYLSSLTDLLADQSLKRPTWEKLKTLKN